MNDMQRVYGFSDEEIAACGKKDRLLSLEIEFSGRCNWKCPYCYSERNMYRDDEMVLEEMLDVISQARALGARKIIYLGAGEPFLDKKLDPVIQYVHKLGMEHIVFTNATLINPETARFLYAHRVVVVVKRTSNDPAVFDRLSGCPGSFKAMERGIKFLREAGYPDEEHHLGIESIVSIHNIHELAGMWRWARQNGIVPYIECITRKGGAANPENAMAPDKPAVKALFEELSRIDAQEFGQHWVPCPPIAGFACKRHLYSCIVNSQGSVQPCVGVELPLGNIRKERLADILANSVVMRELSRVHRIIKGPCSACEHNAYCYGCRGNAYNLTGDYLASDPTCWRINDETAPGSACC